MAGGDGDEETFRHDPVMATEIVELFAPVPDGVVLDATVGGGGHAGRVLASRPGLRLVGLDQDPDALAAAGRSLAEFGARVELRRARFDRLGTVIRELGHDGLVGVLFDLGVSSPQLDRADRGFSYRNEGPLDMRMDPEGLRTAADLVNDLPERDLADVLRRYADERHASRIARAIVAARPFSSTVALAEVVRDAIPAAARRTGGHPAKRTFQAIRIAVNDELGVLAPALDDAIALLVPAGRIVVLAYHSGEDRIVKARLRHAETGGCTCPVGLPCACGAVRSVRLLNRGARRATASEIERNPRAESVRLRAAERLDGIAA